MTRAFICGCAATSLSAEEKAFLREAQPWGAILFRRNVASREQLRALTSDIREQLGAEAPILVDQEGGRVQRLAPPHWRAYPAAAAFLRLGLDAAATARLVRLGARLIAHDLHEVGVDVDCLPVLDTPCDGAHDVIGDRAYGRDPAEIARLGRAAAEGLLAGGVLPVIKHIPGHGRARADSHKELPVVEASRAELEERDFQPFRADADLPLAMTAHVVYTAIDPERPGTLSPTVIGDIIRGLIGFDGLLMTDDISMKALSGGFRDRAEAAIRAGCDIVLHCNGALDEARAVAEGAEDLSGRALERAQAALARRGTPEDFDPVDGVRELDAALAATA
jgi:beta-N-acetylhexosaminidase